VKKSKKEHEQPLKNTATVEIRRDLKKEGRVVVLGMKMVTAVRP